MGSINLEYLPAQYCHHLSDGKNEVPIEHVNDLVDLDEGALDLDFLDLNLSTTLQPFSLEYHLLHREFC